MYSLSSSKGCGYNPRMGDAENKSINGWLLWLLLGVSVVGCNSLAFSPILSDLSHSFNQDPGVVARAAGAYGGATAFASFFLARYSENIGMRKMLMIGCAMLTIGIGSCALALNWIMLAVSQTIAGLAAGIMLPAIYAMASSIAPKGKESVYVGRVITGWSLAMVLGIPFAALIADLWGWRFAYVIMSLVCASSFVGMRQLPPYKRQHKTKILSAKNVLQIPDVFAVLLICLLFMLSFYGVYLFIGDFARSSLDISASKAGLLVMSYGGGFALGSFGDSIIDRYGPRQSIKIVLVAIAVMYSSMFIMTGSFIALLIVCGIWGFANHFGLNCILVILNCADPENKGAIMGIYTTITYVATLMATVIFGFLYIHYEFSALIILAMLNCLIAAIIAGVKLKNKD